MLTVLMTMMEGVDMWENRDWFGGGFLGVAMIGCVFLCLCFLDGLFDKTFFFLLLCLLSFFLI